MAEKKPYVVDYDKKVITINDEVKITPIQEKDVYVFVAAGYKLRHKSVARQRVAEERAKKEKSVEEIEEILKPYEDLAKEFEEMKKGKGPGKGAFAAKSWYKNTAKPEIERREEAAAAAEAPAAPAEAPKEKKQK